MINRDSNPQQTSAGGTSSDADWQPGETRLSGTSADLPAYAPLLAAQHTAHRGELEKLLNDLPLGQGDRVIDAPCGDGAYSELFARHCGPEGKVLAVDNSLEFLRAARETLPTEGIDYLAADVYALPFRESSFDFAWCAQSFMSLPDPVEALRELRRVVRRGGHVAALEQDQLHWMILPWPPEVEIAVHKAQRIVFQEQDRSTENLYFGRHLRELMQEAGLHSEQRKTCTIDRQFPLPPQDMLFLDYYFQDLWSHVQPHLSPDMAERVYQLIHPQSPDYLPRQRNFEMTCNYVIAVGRK